MHTSHSFIGTFIVSCFLFFQTASSYAQDIKYYYLACEQAIEASDTVRSLEMCGKALDAIYADPEADTLLDVMRFYYTLALEYNGQIHAAKDTMLALTDDIYAVSGCSDDYITVQDMLVLYYGMLHDAERKIASINEVIGCVESLYGDSIEYLVTYYYLAGEEYLLTGDYAASIRYFEKSKALHKKIYGQPDAFYARILVEMSSPYFSIGQLDRSIAADEEALAVLDALGDSSYDVRADAYQLLAWAHLQKDSVELALSYVQKQIDATQHLDQQLKANILVGAALFIINFDINNNTTIAKENNFAGVLHEALYIYDSLPPDPIYINNVYLALGNYYSHEGESDSVIYYYELSAQLLEDVYGRNNVIYMNALSTLASYYTEAGRLSEAQKSYEDLNALGRSFLQSNFLFLSSEEQETFLSSFEDYQLLLYNFYTTQPAMSASAGAVLFDGALFMKGLLLQNITALRNKVYASGSPQERQYFDEWTAVKQQLAGLLIANDARAQDVAALAEDLEKKLLRSGFTQLNDRKPVSWQDVKKALGSDEAVIEIIRCYHNGEEVYFASVLRSGSVQPALIRLCTGNELYALTNRRTGETETAYIDRLYGSYDPAFPEDSVYFNGLKLHALLWAPLADELDDVQTVFISAEGVLHQIAWHAIPDAQLQPMIMNRSVIYVNSARDILADAPEQSSQTMLLTGGLSYRTEQTQSGWPYLPGTLTEIEKIAALASAENIPVAILSGTDATEAVVTGQVSGRSFIHFATHAFVLSEPITVISAPGHFYASAADPLLRCGLILSKGDAAWLGLAAPGGTDNILTAYEIAGLDLTKTSLVVLSACETSLGDVRGSEGVYGLQRAFRIAGAGSLIISLWQVPDAYTAELMQLFYQKLLSGASPEASLHAAQRKMQEKSSVYYWAAFKLVR